MKVSELIEKLKDMPQDAEVMKSSAQGCSECNPEGMDYNSDVFYVEYLEQAHYPNSEKHIVVL